MYNRYIPQPDGSYRRKQVSDAHRLPQPATQDICPSPPPEESPEPPRKDPSQTVQRPRPRPQKRTNEPSGGFLQQLLPKDFDTGDLIVILLLLLMAGDCEEDRNNALLTIALYFMM